ncbi:hypothetical protein pipiens_007908 [Culex pipiens pipiens]|uniref:Cytochrome P450 n=1 Tax=Culex pipiens pipiens TaxID=38569 RepID=A0ABD1DN69_CULPP
MLAYVLLSTALSLSTVLLLKLVWSYRFAAKIPTVQPAVPLLGHIPMFWNRTSEQAFSSLTYCFRQVDRLGKVLFGPVLLVFVHHPDLLQQLFSREDLHDRPFFYDFLGLGNGLLSERNGHKWIRSRKVLNPAFNTRMLTGFIPIMDGRARKLVAKMKPLAGTGTEFDILQYIGECTLEMAFSTTMGRNANELPGQKEYVKNLEMIMNLIGERVLNVNQFLDVFYRMTEAYRVDKKARTFCNAFTDKVIRERRRELEKEKGLPKARDEFQSKSLNFLDQILTIRKKDGSLFGDEEISNNLYNMMAAGNDTSSLTIAFACLFLAMHPEIQDKVLEEMNSVFHSDAVDITLDTLKQLQYTEQVIKEVLRLCPAVPCGARQTSGNQVTLDGIHLPPNQIVVFNIFTLHRRKDLWGADAECFNPDRFAPEATKQRHPYAFVPFSAGLRDCIGARYAMNSIRIVLLRILQDFEIKTNLRHEDFRFKFEITLKLAGPHSVWLEKRNKSV